MKQSKIAALRPRQYASLLFGLLFLWPAVVNGGPFFFDDTTAYIRGVDAAAYKATGVPSEWTLGAVQPGTERSASASATTPSAATAPAPAVPTKPVLLGRSAYYGAMLYLGIVLDSFWSVLALQALLAAAAVLTLLRHLVDPANERRFAYAASATFAVAAITPLPFFVCLLMPDLFSGLAIIAAAIVVCGWDRERPLVRLGLVGLLSLAALVHSSNILLVAGMGALFALLALLRPRKRRDDALRPPATTARLVPAGILIGCALLGLGGETLFSTAIKSITGQPPIRPPFLTARFVDDGPGTQYLREHCPRSPFLLCRFVDRLPMPSDNFLWDKNPSTGVFMTLPPEKQRVLASEQSRFILASVRNAPVASAQMVLRDFMKQIGKTGLAEFNYTKAQRGVFNLKIPKGPLAEVKRSLAYSRGVTTRPFEGISLVLTIGSLGVFLWFWLRRPSLVPGLGYAGVAVVGILVNDLICGCLSTPHDRYQMRVIWVLPVIALLILIAQRRGSRPQAVVDGPTLDDIGHPPVAAVR